MNSSNSLPNTGKQKKINKKEFIQLAKKVKKIFEEEEKYLQNERNQSPKFFISS